LGRRTIANVVAVWYAFPPSVVGHPQIAVGRRLNSSLEVSHQLLIHVSMVADHFAQHHVIVVGLEAAEILGDTASKVCAPHHIRLRLTQFVAVWFMALEIQLVFVTPSWWV
jgi:hypothetical protein